MKNNDGRANALLPLIMALEYHTSLHDLQIIERSPGVGCPCAVVLAKIHTSSWCTLLYSLADNERYDSSVTFCRLEFPVVPQSNYFAPWGIGVGYTGYIHGLFFGMRRKVMRFRHDIFGRIITRNYIFMPCFCFLP